MAHILIADDDELVLEILAPVFRSAGHTVCTVVDGKQVLAALKVRPADLLVLDCMMPRMNGIEVLRILRTSQDYCRLPIIMLTARNSPGDKEVALNSRVDMYCSKQCDPDWLVFQAEDLIESKARIAPVAINSWQEIDGPLRHC